MSGEDGQAGQGQLFLSRPAPAGAAAFQASVLPGNARRLRPAGRRQDGYSCPPPAGAPPETPAAGSGRPAWCWRPAGRRQAALQVLRPTPRLKGLADGGARRGALPAASWTVRQDIPVSQPVRWTVFPPAGRLLPDPVLTKRRLFFTMTVGLKELTQKGEILAGPPAFREGPRASGALQTAVNRC